MWKIYVNVLVVVLITFFSCGKSNSDITTGFIGNVIYGEGDCMPIIDETTRVYNDFNGDICFIVKSDLDNLGNGDFDVLKAKSIKKSILGGRLAIELPVDTYLVMPSDVYMYSNNNTIIIEKGVTLVKDFKFWKCTSY